MFVALGLTLKNGWWSRAIAPAATLALLIPFQSLVELHAKTPLQQESTKEPAAIADHCDPRGIDQLLADLGLGEPSPPSESDKWVCRGDEEERAGNHERAIETYREAIRLEPNNATAHFRLADALKNQGDLGGAIAEYHQSLRLKPNLVDAHLHLAESLSERKETDAALTEAREATRLAPEDAYAHAGLCKAFGEENDLNGALFECRKALSLQPDAALLPWLHRSYGILLETDGDLEGAIAEFREAVHLKPDEPEAHYRLGNALDEKGEQARAEPELREALRINPTYADARLALGKLLSAECLRDKAALLAKIPAHDLAASPQGFQDLMNLPFGHCEEAVAESRKTLALKPNWPEAHHELATALWESGDAYRDEALKEYATACSLDPSNPKFCNDYQNYEKRWDPKHHRNK